MVLCVLSFPRTRESRNHLQYYSHLWSISIYFSVLLFAAPFSFQTDLKSHNWQDFQSPWSQLSTLLQATMMTGKDYDPLSLSPLVGCKPAIVVAAQIINHSSNSSVICFPLCSSNLNAIYKYLWIKQGYEGYEYSLFNKIYCGLLKVTWHIQTWHKTCIVSSLTSLSVFKNTKFTIKNQHIL